MSQPWLRIINLPLLAASILTYTLGAGIADYLGYSPDGWSYAFGQVIVLLTLVCSRILYSYYELLKQGAQPFDSKVSGRREGSVSPQALLIIAIVLITFTIV